MASKNRIIIIGAGFGGLEAAKRLKNADAEITLIDKRNHHLFQPLLYQVATAGLSPSDIAWPIRSILSGQKNVRVILGDVDDVDIDNKTVHTDQNTYPYDYLIIATGARHSYFGQDHWEPHAPGLKRIIDATEIRKRLLIAFERAEATEDPVEQKRQLTFCVVGGGPTGVEMAGAIAELANHALAKDFTTIDPGSARVMLAEAGSRVLAAFPEELSIYAQGALAKLGVEVVLNKLVAIEDGAGVRLGDVKVPCATVMWAAGVYVPRVANWIGVETDASGRVPVQSDLSLEGQPDTFIVGDAAKVAWNDTFVPGIAPAAKQEGRYVANVLLAKMGAGKTPDAFEYSHKGNLATIGRHTAVVDFGKIRLKGWFAWWLWGVAHIYFLIGVRAPIIVGWQWLWSYLTFGRGARLITGIMPLFNSPKAKEDSSQ